MRVVIMEGRQLSILLAMSQAILKCSILQACRLVCPKINLSFFQRLDPFRSVCLCECLLKGLFTFFLFSVRSHILNSNGVWYW